MNSSGNSESSIDDESRDEPVEGWSVDQYIASVPDNCARFMEPFLDELARRGWSGRDEFGIRMAMEEAIMNAIDHGNRRDPSKTVHIVIRLTSARFFAKITDQGDGFDPLKLPDPTLEENLENSRGRGVMLIKRFVDSATYNQKGNSVELRKVRSRI